MATVQSLITDLYEVVSKNTELDPTDPAGQAILTRYLQRAYEYVLSLKLPRGGTLGGLLQAYQAIYVNLSPVTGTAQAGSASSITLEAGSSTTDDAYNGYAIRLTGGTGSGQDRIITDYDGTTQTVTVFPAWDTTPNATSTYLLSTRRIKISSSPGPFTLAYQNPRNLQSLVRLSKLNSDTRLELSRLPSIDESARTELGEPSAFVFLPGLILLDKAPEEAVTLEALFRVIPAFPSSIVDELELPAPWEQAVVLYARWWILVRYGELQDAYAAKKDFFDFVSSVPLPGEETPLWQDARIKRLY
jgi:hypothetical protein